MPVARQRPRDPARHPIAGDPRRRGGRDVQHHDVRRAELSERLHPHARLESCTHTLEQRDHRAADRGRSTFGDRPAVAVCRRAEGHADRRGHRRAERPEGMGRDAGEQRPRLLGRPAASEHRRRQRGEQAEPGQLERVLGHVQHRSHEIGGDVVEALSERSEHRLPPPAVRSEPVRGRLDRLVGRGAGAAVERVRVLNLWPAPRQPVRAEVEATGKCRVDGQRVSGRALVVKQAGKGQLAGAGAASQRVGRLQHGHVDALGRQGEGGSEPVGPAADHDCAGHAVTA